MPAAPMYHLCGVAPNSILSTTFRSQTYAEEKGLFQRNSLRSTNCRAKQPGWEGGTYPGISWSAECDKESFNAAIARLKAAKVPSYHTEPNWVGYWSYPVRDPAGNTVEITCPDKENGLKT